MTVDRLRYRLRLGDLGWRLRINQWYNLSDFMEWTRYRSPDFDLEHPMGWQVRRGPGAVATVASPTGESFAVIEAILLGPGDKPSDILAGLRFASSRSFLEPRLQPVTTGPADVVRMSLDYRTPSGAAGRARITGLQRGNVVAIYTSAAPADRFAAMEPDLARIHASFRPAQTPATTTTVSPQSASGAIAYTRFHDPQMDTFSIEVPAGWKLRGGFNHPAMGDRRPWVETMSADGIYILNGDPDFPQSFCHFPGNPEGVPILLTGGTALVNLTPSADRIADHYLGNLGKNRFGAFEALPRRPRPEVVEFLRAQWTRQGVALTPGFKIWAVETPVRISCQSMQRVGSLLVTAAFSGQYTLGMFTFWGGNVFLYVAPPELAPRAEAVRWHMIESYQDTPRMQQVVQQDETMIAQAGQAANAAQWNWFAGQQAAHRAQLATGDTIVSNYWQQQQTNDAMMRGWERNQAIDDQLSQARSDEILDRQRLADDAMGKLYEAPAGYDYYWLDQQTGQIVGTNSGDPPNLTGNYTPLRRL